MGNAPKLQKEESVQLEKTYGYDEKELLSIYKHFRKGAPNGSLDKNHFKDIMRMIGINDEFLVDLVFNNLDISKKNEIGFNDFLEFLSIFIKGDNDKKIKFSFQLYDIDGDGYISKNEMITIAKSLFKLNDSLITFSGEAYTDPVEFVDDYFEKMDLDGDDKISYEDFLEGSMKNSDVLQGLGWDISK
eukprot:TRINITY_DN2963_c0_g1_i1.p1 TRINITY_DN2963_c0_g1~~TRINITY_DN2963_c0_g1_i1.p1  ORF type:complete len:188 (-),score=63.08 TRINITY_DN2963_c0_g1_i1:34-597(-)